MNKLIWKLFAAVLALCAVTHASDHLDAPNLNGKGNVDVNDLYVFQSPTNPNNSVLILTVNPFAGTLSDTDFGSDVTYEFQVDNNADAIADVTYSATFATNGTGQDITLTRDSVTVATGNAVNSLATSGGGTVQAGLFDDPFFFDLAGFQDGFNFTGSDAFAGANVSAIVLEVPSTELGGPDVGVWARTLQGGSQVDRVGRPAINTALIPTGRKEEFNLGTPSGDLASFGGDVEATITALSNAENAGNLTPVLLPDVLTFNTASGDGFLNGRQLQNDVIDAELGLLSAGAVTGDGVNMNDVAFRNSFPYLAAPNVVPEPSGIVIVLFGLPALHLIRRRKRS
jgi:hypothetical protein